MVFKQYRRSGMIMQRNLFRSVSRNKEIDYLGEFDYFLLGVALLITAIGLVFLDSAMGNMYTDGGSGAMRVQIVGLILGLICAVVMAVFDYNLLKRITIPFYLFNVFLMLCVYTPLGIEENGSRAWLDFKVITYQPSELMKLAMVLVVAKELEQAQEEGFTKKNAVKILAAYLVPLGLIFLQRDIGQALVLTFAFLLTLFIGRAKWWYILSIVGVGASFVPFVWKYYINGVRRARLLAFLDPEKYLDYSLQLRRAQTAIGSGRLVGKGLGEGPMNNGKKILVKLSDSIFAVIGEEGGFIMTVLVVVLFTILLMRMCYISYRARDMFGQCVAIGIFAMFFFNVFENIGMNLGVMPITGLPLPFVSKGGSAMITNFFAIGVLLSVSLRRKRKFFEDM